MSREAGLLTGFLEKKRNRIAASYLRGPRVLDVGCNQGHLREYLDPSQHYVGIDPHPDTVPAFDFYLKSGFDDLTELGEFDAVALIAVIEHVTESQRLLSNLFKHVKKGGVIVITTPTKFGDKLHHWFARMGVVSLDAADDHQHIFDLDELAGQVTQAGFEIVVKKKFLFGGNQVVVGKKN
jgi:2-polyprenyl-3-methyl-5-hydroxy-6-metoxy-1,4-benzoquinol methylase